VFHHGLLDAAGNLPQGDYLYLLARATIRAAREQDALLPVIINLRSLETLDEDASELCLGRMVREGADIAPPSLDSDALDAGYSAAESILVERFEARRGQAERVNQAFVDARMTSVRESYRVKISRKQTLLDNARKAKSAGFIYPHVGRDNSQPYGGAAEA
jgi:hypothetical protein